MGAAIGLAALLTLAGCGSSGSGASSNNEPAPAAGSGSAKIDINPKTGKQIVMGFAQVGAESGWRTANTQSIKDEAAKRGIDLKFSDAQGKQENEIKAIRGFIAQGVDIIAFSPIVETGWGPVLQEAKKAGIPVIVSDRRPDVPDDLYVTFIGSDFVQEGQRAAQWLADHTGGKATIAEITGTTGSAPANDRAKGFRDVLAKYPGMQIASSETGDFKRDNGKQVMEALLKSPTGSKITALFCHNDDMAIGAIQAIKEAGKKPGKDIVIVSIDGIKDALEALKDGETNYVVECNPLLGPRIMDAVEATLAGKTLEKRTVVPDEAFDQAAAIKALPDRKY
ncbi:MAG TPA: ABC transporter substrate-binding protein [Fimbriimonadaceae bacterium]|nr:ABC transporter substrate-binding protein [Fimbriimonadaceae bacterium]